MIVVTSLSVGELKRLLAIANKRSIANTMLIGKIVDDLTAFRDGQCSSTVVLSKDHQDRIDKLRDKITAYRGALDHLIKHPEHVAKNVAAIGFDINEWLSLRDTVLMSENDVRAYILSGVEPDYTQVDLSEYLEEITDGKANKET